MATSPPNLRIRAACPALRRGRPAAEAGGSESPAHCGDYPQPRRTNVAIFDTV